MTRARARQSCNQGRTGLRYGDVVVGEAEVVHGGGHESRIQGVPEGLVGADGVLHAAVAGL